jgi:hypothetical protein
MSADATAAKILQRMIDRAEADIAEAERTIQARGVLIVELRRELATLSVPAVRPRIVRSMADQIAEVLKAENRPMRPVEVTAKLKELGVQSIAKRGLLPMVASVLNKRKQRFTQIGRGVYALKEGG